MMVQVVKITLCMTCLFLVLTQAGCRDVKEIQNLNYATAIGVDFKDGKYHSYIQMVGLETVAKTEGQVGGTGNVWVSEAIADTFNDAFFEVYKTAQERIIWAHVSTIVLSEDAISEGFHHIFDGLTRYYEFRLTPWVFGTKEPVKDVLSTVGFYGQTALDTIIHEPMRMYEQSSTLRPIRLHRLAKEIYEPGETTFIPSITIDKEQWEKNKESEPKLTLNGAFYIRNQHYKGFFNLDLLNGLRWFTPETVRAALLVPDDKNTHFLVVFEFPKAEIAVKASDEKPRFHIKILANGYFVNRNTNATLKLEDIIESSKKALKKEIEDLYALGIKKDVDFLNLEHYLFRKDFSTWKKLRKDGELFIDENSIENLTIDLTINHTGAIKNRSIDINNIE